MLSTLPEMGSFGNFAFFGPYGSLRRGTLPSGLRAQTTAVTSWPQVRTWRAITLGL
jgi:hypothetical protein